MARKKTKKNVVKIVQPKMAKEFDCPHCNSANSVQCKLDWKTRMGKLECRICEQEKIYPIHNLSEPINLYSDWYEEVQEDKDRKARGDMAGMGLYSGYAEDYEAEQKVGFIDDSNKENSHFKEEEYSQESSSEEEYEEDEIKPQKVKSDGIKKEKGYKTQSNVKTEPGSNKTKAEVKKQKGIKTKKEHTGYDNDFDEDDEEKNSYLTKRKKAMKY